MTIASLIARYPEGPIESSLERPYMPPFIVLVPAIAGMTLLVMWSGHRRAGVAYGLALGLLGAALLFSAVLPKYYVVPFYLAPFPAIYGFAEQRGWPRVEAATEWCALFPVGFFLAQLTLQWRYELSTAGHLTSAMDGCAAALAPIGFVLFLGCDVAAIAILSRLTLPKGGQAYTLVGAVVMAVGAFVGYTHWADWQINRPCF